MFSTFSFQSLLITSTFSWITSIEHRINVPNYVFSSWIPFISLLLEFHGFGVCVRVLRCTFCSNFSPLSSYRPYRPFVNLPNVETWRLIITTIVRNANEWVQHVVQWLDVGYAIALAQLVILYFDLKCCKNMQLFISPFSSSQPPLPSPLSRTRARLSLVYGANKACYSAIIQ